MRSVACRWLPQLVSEVKDDMLLGSDPGGSEPNVARVGRSQPLLCSLQL